MHRVALSAARQRASRSAKTTAVAASWHSRRLSQNRPPPPPPGGPSSSASSSSSTNKSESTSESDSDWRTGSPAKELSTVHNLYAHNFAQPTLSSLDFFRRLLKFSALGLLALAGATGVIFEGAHQWVEHRELAPTPDPDGELARWGWDLEAESWTGSREHGGGGTDPALGSLARHAVRGAWIAQHWGAGSAVASSSHQTAKPKFASGPIDAALELAHDFLNVALSAAVQRTTDAQAAGAPSPLRAHTLTDLLMRHAGTLERIGSRGALFDAREEYQRVWAILQSNPDSSGDANANASAGQGRGTARTLDAARVALKLGNLSARLGARDDALDWWARALMLASASDGGNDGPGTGRSKGHSTGANVIASDNAGERVRDRDAAKAKTSAGSATSLVSGASASDNHTRDRRSDAGPATMTAAGTVTLPSQLPSSPHAQRTVASTLAALSAHYAQTGQLERARAVEGAGIELLRTGGTNATAADPDPEAPQHSVSAPHALHDLFLLHRLSLLTLHLAEVNAALAPSSSVSSLHSSSSSKPPSKPSSPDAAPLTHLARAASLSERTASLLTGTSLTHPDAPSSALPAPPTPDAPLAPSYAASRTLQAPARALLRDARRTAVEAWTLSGVLYERQGDGSLKGPGAKAGSTSWGRALSAKHQSDSDSAPSPSMLLALECYERALGWAGVRADEQGGFGQPGEGTLESEWRALWRNYARVRDIVRSGSSSTSSVGDREQSGAGTAKR